MGKKKIAILGGGVGSLVTAHYLTRTPELRAQHDVTIYQMGWRVGGKGASGRSMRPDEAKRIEEHGLHLWFGFYENAFRTIQEVYARKPSHADDKLVTWRDGFKPCSFTPIGEDYDGQLSYWPLEWPTNTDVPGGGLMLSAGGVLSQLASVMRTVAQALLDSLRGGGVIGGLKNAVLIGELAALLGVLELLSDGADTAIGRFVSHFVPLRAIANAVRKAVQHEADAHLGDPTFRRLFSVLDIGLTTLLGVLDPKYGILDGDTIDLDRIDDVEYRAWLLDNGCNEWVVKKSSYLRALYDLPFAYEDGDIAKPGLGAGTAVRIILRIVFTYKEACFYEMQAGMGEVVVAPLYEVLLQQGVKFEFFRKVKKLELTPDKRWIGKVHLERQVDLVSGPYRPLFRVDGITCWPSEPFWDQIVNGAAIKAQLELKKSSLESNWCDVPPAGTETLALGTDFDLVVLGIALPAFKRLNAQPSMCEELITASPRFGAMVDGLAIVPTQSFQIWTKDDLRGLGWAAMRKDPPAMNAAPEPYSVWADCSHVVPREGWPANGPKSVFYFCGPWKNDLTRKPTTDASVPALAHDQVRASAIDWLKQYVGYMWPNAKDPANPAGLDWNALYDPTGQAGEARMDFQWIRPNVDPTECCEASLPGTTKLRLKADESGFENLFMAGAWLRTGINATCVEAAVMSGMDCARAISGEPLEIVGEWFCMRKSSA